MKPGWKTVKLGEVARFDKFQGYHSGLPYVGLEHIESGTRKFLGSRSDAEVQSATFMFNPEHVLYGRLRPYLRKVLVPDFAGHCSTEIFPILPSKDLDRSFLSYWLISEATTADINSLCNGARMPRANMEKALDLEIPLPPLAEQKRIVALLDEAFAGIDQAKAKRDSAISSARLLLESQLESLFMTDSGNWKGKPLGEWCKSVTVGHVGETSSHYRDEGVTFLRTQNVTGNRLLLDDVKFITSDFHKSLKKSQVKPGDLLLSRVITRNVSCAIVPDVIGEANCANVVLVRPGEHLDSEFLFYYISTKSAQSYLLSKKVGSAQLVVNTKVVKDWPVKVPSLPLQRQIAGRARGFSGELESFVKVQTHLIAEFDSLKSAFMTQAFAGAL